MKVKMGEFGFNFLMCVAKSMSIIGFWRAFFVVTLCAGLTFCGVNPRSGPPSSQAASAGPSAAPVAVTKPTARPLPQLPLGGRVLFPAYRVVAFYGAPGVPNMGRSEER